MTIFRSVSKTSFHPTAVFPAQVLSSASVVQAVGFEPFAAPPGQEQCVPSARVPYGRSARVPAEQVAPALIAAESLVPVLVTAQGLVRPEA